MTLDYKSLLDRLAMHQLQVVAPAVSDPKIARAAGVTGMLLQQTAMDIDTAPGRFRKRAADSEAIITAYASNCRAPERYQELVAAPVDQDRLSGLYARDCILNAALIEIADAIANESAPWAVKLRQDMRETYLRWTD